LLKVWRLPSLASEIAVLKGTDIWSTACSRAAPDRLDVHVQVHAIDCADIRKILVVCSFLLIESPLSKGGTRRWSLQRLAAIVEGGAAASLALGYAISCVIAATCSRP
jgi:hypothetical protein